MFFAQRLERIHACLRGLPGAHERVGHSLGDRLFAHQQRQFSLGETSDHFIQIHQVRTRGAGVILDVFVGRLECFIAQLRPVQRQPAPQPLIPGVEAVREFEDFGLRQVQALQQRQLLDISRPLQRHIGRNDFQRFELVQRCKVQAVEARALIAEVADLQALKAGQCCQPGGKLLRQLRRPEGQLQVLEAFQARQRERHVGQQRTWHALSAQALGGFDGQAFKPGKIAQELVDIAVMQGGTTDVQLAHMGKVRGQGRQRRIQVQRQDLGAGHLADQHGLAPTALEGLGGQQVVMAVGRRCATDPVIQHCLHLAVFFKQRPESSGNRPDVVARLPQLKDKVIDLGVGQIRVDLAYFADNRLAMVRHAPTGVIALEYAVDAHRGLEPAGLGFQPLYGLHAIGIGLFDDFCLQRSVLAHLRHAQTLACIIRQGMHQRGEKIIAMAGQAIEGFTALIEGLVGRPLFDQVLFLARSLRPDAVEQRTVDTTITHLQA